MKQFLVLWSVAMLGTANGVAAFAAESAKLLDCRAATAMAATVKVLNDIRADGRGCDGTKPGTPLPLHWSDQLAQVALQQAGELAAQRRLVHRDRADRPLAVRLAAGGYAVGHAVENVAFGYPGPDDVAVAWRASGPHCANLMDDAVSEAGLGCADRDGTRYWVLVLGTPAAVARTAAPPRGRDAAARPDGL